MDPKISGFDRVKFLLTSLGTAIVGGLVFLGPESLREEIPWHRELGAGFFGFALLMLGALFSVRVKALLITLISAAVAAGTLFVAINSADWPIWQRAIFGLLGAGAGVFAIFSFIGIFTGEDPSN